MSKTSRKLVTLALVLLTAALSLLGCTAADPLRDSVYLSELYVDGVTINGELIPPAIYARWSLTTVNNNPEIMNLDGVAGRRFVLAPNSIVGFKLYVVARDTGGDVSAWRVENGSIRRAGDNTATLLTSTTNLVYQDDATWDITITGVPADDALSITVIGDAVNETRWSAVLYGVEVHF